MLLFWFSEVLLLSLSKVGVADYSGYGGVRLWERLDAVPDKFCRGVVLTRGGVRYCQANSTQQY